MKHLLKKNTPNLGSFWVELARNVVGKILLSSPLYFKRLGFDKHIYHEPPKPWKNAGFGHRKIRLFTIKKTSENIGLGGPWYIWTLQLQEPPLTVLDLQKFKKTDDVLKTAGLGLGPMIRYSNSWSTLPETNSSHLKIGRAPKAIWVFQPIHFQVRTVWFREGGECVQPDENIVKIDSNPPQNLWTFRRTNLWMKPLGFLCYLFVFFHGDEPHGRIRKKSPSHVEDKFI